MLKINYTSTICTDVLRDLENCMKTDDIDSWLEKQVQTIDFNCYNFPHDEEAYPVGNSSSCYVYTVKLACNSSLQQLLQRIMRNIIIGNHVFSSVF